MINIAEKSLADVRLPQKNGFLRFIKREPLGVTLGVVTWNYPYMCSVHYVIPALLAGK
jgi:acyl-CoA reductase-like NAD-dependent aldehyde dehydrogenase